MNKIGVNIEKQYIDAFSFSKTELFSTLNSKQNKFPNDLKQVPSSQMKPTTKSLNYSRFPPRLLLQFIRHSFNE